jgi:hypothetical protein
VNDASEGEEPGCLEELLVLEESPEGFGSIEEKFRLRGERKHGSQLCESREGEDRAVS